MSPDDLWVLGLRANDATGCRPRWMLVSFRQLIADLGHHEPAVEAEWRAHYGLTLPEDPEGGEEPFADMVERLFAGEGEEWLLFGPWGRPAAGREAVGEHRWDELTRWQSEADWQRTLSHTYVLESGARVQVREVEW